MSVRIGNRLMVAGCTDVGMVRTHNEDNFRLDPHHGLVVVADGMGGHDAGEVASAGVIDSLCDYIQHQTGDLPLEELDLDDEVPTFDPFAATSRSDEDEPTQEDLPNPVFSLLVRALMRANAQINEQNLSRGYPVGTGMGSTIVGLWLPEFSERPAVFHVGDSRCYHYSQGSLRQVTRDHSMYQQWVDFGGKGNPPAQNILMQAMGPHPNITPDVQFVEMTEGDTFLLCTDGLSGMVGDEQIAAILASAQEESLDEACQELIRLANAQGGKDNITVVLGRVCG